MPRRRWWSSDLTWIKQPSEKLFAAHAPEPRASYVVMRIQEPHDAPQIRELLEASFPGFEEALLVDRLRSDGESCFRWSPRIRASSSATSLFAAHGGRRRRRVSRRGAGAARGLSRIPAAGDRHPSRAGGHACLAALGETLSVVLGEKNFTAASATATDASPLRERISVAISDGAVLRRGALARAARLPTGLRSAQR